jgi:16S rRNA (cytosine967-C5)-methyltransferase
MPRDARQVAQAVLGRVEAGGFASEVLTAQIEAAGLAPADRRLATELVYGVLRQRIRLDRALRAMLDRGAGRALREPVGTILRVGAYQILFLDRVPDHAAVNQAVRAARKARGQRIGGLVNAVLRRLGREGEPPLPEDDSLESLALRTATPLWIAERLQRAVGDELGAALEGINAPASLAVRASLTGHTRAEVAERLGAELGEGGTVEVVSLCPEALVVSGLGSVRASPSFAEGLWTVQDVAAQLVGHLVAPADGDRVLDACAGAGGKTTHLAQLAPGARIDAVDVSPSNLTRGREHAERLGVDNVRFHQGALADVTDLEAEYDLILVDAPCSGLGVLRRHPEAKHRVGEEDIVRHAATQSALLDVAADKVRPGGALVYAVCTFTDEEGPEQVAAFLDRHPDFSLEPPPGGIDFGPVTASDGSMRCWPHRHGTDGFYAARLHRRANSR